MHRSNFPIILIVALLFAAIGAPAPAWAKRVALVIGIDQYDNLKPDQQLKKAVNDSRSVGEALRSLGYDVQEAENVSRLDLLRQWQRFLNGVDAGDEAAFYFAGHGVEIDGLNFLLPKVVPRVASGEEEVLKASALSLNGFLDQVRGRKPQTMIYMVDACRDNPFTSSTGRSIGRTRGLTLVEPPSGTFVMFSAGPSQERPATEAAKVSISSQARELAAGGVSEVSSKKLEALKAAVQNGTFEINPQLVAERMIDRSG
jgi:flagellar biosynthesis anti-sigma factor FlgM